jgi:ketosteroid isomerase-like protein
MYIRTRVNELQQYIRDGRILDAMKEFYDENTVMQENVNPPTVGLANNIERENQFLSNVKEWKGFAVKAVAVDKDTSFVEATFDFVTREGKAVHLEQVAVARWKNGKIVHERFYYEPKN